MTGAYAARSPRRADARAARSERGSRPDRTLFGVPERFMRPRLIFIAVTAVIVGFGLLMVYSSSSVTALAEEGDAAYYLKRQLIFALVGTAVAVVIAFTDYHTWCDRFVMPVWVATIVALVLVFATKGDAYGATRWIAIGSFQLQPSEFAKITVVLVAGGLAQRYFEEGTLTWDEFVKYMAIGVGVPIALIIFQPDKGTTMVLGITIVLMAYLAGLEKRIILAFLALGVLAFLGLSLKDDYSRQRLLTMFDPWKDPFDTGYQLIQGFYAFGSGGLFGVGIGFSRQKYSYLPMAHNDFIFAVVGEECGLVGTLGVLAGFAVFAWAGLRIAQHAPDLAGRLIAAGCTSLIVTQMLLNVAGVIGIFPLSGKPIPFISYGGSSVIASIMVAGMIVSVSVHSHLPETAHDSARRSWQLEGAEGPGRPGAGGRGGLSFVGEPVPRSQRARVEGRDPGPEETRRGFTVVSGGARAGRGQEPGRGAGARDARDARTRRGSPGRGAGASGRVRSGRAQTPPRGRMTTDASGRRRIDLGPSASERLRGRGDSGRGRRR